MYMIIDGLINFISISLFVIFCSEFNLPLVVSIDFFTYKQYFFNINFSFGEEELSQESVISSKRFLNWIFNKRLIIYK